MEIIAGDVNIINQEGRQVKIHGNQLYQARLPTEHNKREHLLSEDAGDGEQPHDDRDNSNSNRAPTRPTPSDILSSAQPPPPHHSSNRSRAPTRPTASDVHGEKRTQLSCARDKAELCSYENVRLDTAQLCPRVARMCERISLLRAGKIAVSH